MIASHLFVPPGSLGTEAPSEVFSLPPAAAESAASFDALYTVIVAFALVATFLVAGRAALSAIKRNKDHLYKASKPSLFWLAALPGVLLFVILFWGQEDYIKMSSPGADALDVRVTARGWQWTIEYPMSATGPARETVEACVPAEGSAEDQTAVGICGLLIDAETCSANSGCAWDPEAALPLLLVPQGRPVRLLLTSEDRSYSFHIPAFRMQKAVVPGRYTSLSFTATELGTFPVISSEYSGVGHAGMLAKVKVVEPGAFAGLLKTATKAAFDPNMPPAERGAIYFADKGCGACHSLDGSPGVGPSMKSLWGKTEKLGDGTEVLVDAPYLAESLLDPNAKVVDGYPPAMPPFEGQLDDQQVADIIEYIKTLK